MVREYTYFIICTVNLTLQQSSLAKRVSFLRSFYVGHSGDSGNVRESILIRGLAVVVAAMKAEPVAYVGQDILS